MVELACDIARNFDEAHAKIATTRQALQAVASDEPVIRRAAGRLQRLEAEVAGLIGGWPCQQLRSTDA